MKKSYFLCALMNGQMAILSQVVQNTHDDDIELI